MKNLFLYINTLKFLKPEQILSRLAKKIKLKKSYKIEGDLSIKISKKWVFNELQASSFEGENIEFLNCIKKLEKPIDWHPDDVSRLWLYNLHYFNHLLSPNSSNRHLENIDLINDWIDSNPINIGAGWEPYPTSLRIVNFIKYLLNGNKLEKNIISSLYLQTLYLRDNLETDIQANHYFSNLKAILFSGAIFQKESWINESLKELSLQLDEQVLNDGINYELSPMYHDLMLVDILDIYNLLQSYPELCNLNLLEKINKILNKMLTASIEFSHHDKSIPFFNDSVNGIAPKKNLIIDYANKLDIKKKFKKIYNSRVIDFSESGYFIIESSSIKIFFDVCKIAPSYQPGHAHANTLSVETSIKGQKVFVNSGVFEYENTRFRHHQRSTKSHSTVEVNGKNSSQVWSSFRVANRAKIIKRTYKKSNDYIEVMGAHDGYSTFLNKCIHSRKIKLTEAGIFLQDTVSGKNNNKISRIYLHPDVSAYIDKNLLLINHDCFTLECNISNVQTHIVDSVYSPQFGIRQKNKCIEFSFTDETLKLGFLLK